MKHFTLFLISFVCSLGLFAQKDNEERLFSKRVQQGQVSGYLIGKYGPPEAIKYFEFLDLLEADVYLIINNKHLKVDCKIEPANEGLNTYSIRLTFSKEIIKEIGNEQNLKFDFNFYIKGENTNVVKGGTFRTANFERKPNKSIPRSSIQYDPGFVVSSPAELSIYLIQSEVNYFLQRNATYKTENKIKSNYSLQQGIRIDSLKSLPFKLSNSITDTSIGTLAQLMTVYNFCTSHLQPNSFLNYEGNELKNDIDSLMRLVSNFNINDTSKSKRDTLISATAILLAKKEALKMYENMYSELELTKQKIVGIIRQTFYNFDRY